MVEHLPEFGVEVDVGEAPAESVDVNHWLTYSEPWTSAFPAPGYYSRNGPPSRRAKATSLVTHIDDPLKLAALKESLDRAVDLGICMSTDTLGQLVRSGIDPSKLCYVLPAHDSAVAPRRLVVGITSRLYPDGRKREDLIVAMAAKVDLSEFEFRIFGRGWERVVPLLEGAGATVRYEPGSTDMDVDYRTTLEAIPGFDFYLYTGFDEGSMGTLDALAAGVETITTPQGFHLDIDGGITHPFSNAAELIAVFEAIGRERRRRVNGVRELTWRTYARRHAEIWRRLVAGERPVAGAEAAPPGRRRSISEAVRFYANARRSTLRGYFVRSFWYRLKGGLSPIKRRILGARQA
ncbi:glycosyltransferase family 4 protein [Acidobacteria bacterium ACD]|nr:glycosyltransferase family 4 protein [Acidobacteria bacterium ACD]